MNKKLNAHSNRNFNSYNEWRQEMSVDLINKIIVATDKGNGWRAHLLSYSHSKRKGTIYNCRRIELESAERMQQLIHDISNDLIANGIGKLEKYTDVREYDGTCNAMTIYRISENNEDIIVNLDSLFESIANSDTEVNPLEIKAQAYILCGTVVVDKEEHRVKLVSMNTPITSLKNRFLCKNGKFREITEKVLNLRTTVNVIIYDKTIYFLDMSGESLFNMERAYKRKCNEVVNEIESMNIISNKEVFRDVATTGHNPRMFVAFSQPKLKLLSNKTGRERAAKYFKIPLTSDGVFDTNDKKDADKLVKVLCNKAMWDVIEKVPVEVDGSKNWSE